MEELTAVSPQPEESTPENQLANLRDILFGRTAKTLETRLHDAEGELDTHRSRLAAQEEQITQQATDLTAALTTKSSELQETIDQLRNDLTELRQDHAAQMAQMTQQVEQQFAEMQQSHTQFAQQVTNERHQLSDLLIQLGTQLKADQ